jgi:hypothetical protein
MITGDSPFFPLPLPANVDITTVLPGPLRKRWIRDQ